MFGEKGTKTLSYPHFHVPLSKHFLITFTLFLTSVNANQIEESSKFAIINSFVQPVSLGLPKCVELNFRGLATLKQKIFRGRNPGPPPT